MKNEKIIENIKTVKEYFAQFKRPINISKCYYKKIEGYQIAYDLGWLWSENIIDDWFYNPKELSSMINYTMRISDGLIIKEVKIQELNNIIDLFRDTVKMLSKNEKIKDYI
jgi:hypothetical protein